MTVDLETIRYETQIRCDDCIDAARTLLPGQRTTCTACGAIVEATRTARTTSTERAGLPVGRHCRDDLLWYGGARAEIERLHRERLGPAETRCALSSAMVTDKRPSNLLLLLRLDTQRVSDVEARAERIELIERTMDRVLHRGPWLYRLLQEVWLVRGGRVETGWTVYYASLAERCATTEQLAAWHRTNSARRTLQAAWARRALEDAVRVYDEEHG